jgi:hypothetical protein
MSEMVGQGSKYTAEDRLRAAVEFCVSGNMKVVASRTGIPRTTLGDWKRSEWWDEVIGKVRHEKAEELDANLTKLIDSSFEQAQDRVENGDYRVNKEGELFRVPMGGRDLVIAGATVYDKQRLHRNQPTSIKSESRSIEQLQAYFNQMATEHRRANSIEGECEEVE